MIDSDVLKTAGAILVPVLVAVLTYALNKRAERQSRAAQYQLEQIEKILSAIAANGTTYGLPPNSAEEREVVIESQRAMALIPLYGNEEVLKVQERNKNKEYSPDELKALCDALYAQGRKLGRV